MVWLILLAAVLLLALTPMGFRLVYSAQGLVLHFLFGRIRINLYPKLFGFGWKLYKRYSEREKKKKTPEQPEEQVPQEAEGKPSGEEQASAEEKKKDQKGNEITFGQLQAFLPLVKLPFRFVDEFRRKIRVRRLQMRLVMAGDDPCDVALLYGRAWAVVGNLIPLLERIFVIKKRDIQVQCDFTAEKIQLYLRLDVTITAGRLLWLILKFGVLALKEYWKIRNTDKGGAENESELT